MRQHGLHGGTRLVGKKRQSFIFGTLFCGLELFGAAWESGSHVLSIDQMNQRNVNTSGKAGAQIPQLPLGDDSSPWGR
jgi:hypothetical protein